jgi:hypothetical protein
VKQPSRLKSFLFALTMSFGFYLTTPSATACPMCKFANESKQHDEEANRRPQAYMYSILFMLSMPATLLAGFSFGFYRLWKQQQLLMSNVEQPAESDDFAE